jgi:hypothetical protein
LPRRSGSIAERDSARLPPAPRRFGKERGWNNGGESGVLSAAEGIEAEPRLQLKPPRFTRGTAKFAFRERIPTMRSLSFCLSRITIALTAVFLTGLAQAATPATIAAPADAQVVETLAATGVQVYSCEYDDAHHLAWVFRSPLATLYDANGQAAVHHAAGPSWQADDGSRITGHVLAQSPSQTADSIPQLLLETKNAGGAGVLAQVRYVQRIDTAGGTAPTQPCTSEHQRGESPYFAHYVFLK